MQHCNEKGNELTYQERTFAQRKMAQQLVSDHATSFQQPLRPFIFTLLANVSGCCLFLNISKHEIWIFFPVSSVENQREERVKQQRFLLPARGLLN